MPLAQVPQQSRGGGAQMVKFTVNAIIPAARPNAAADAYLTGATLGVANALLGWMRRRDGGLWVGGTVSISEDEIRFDANALNRSLQSGDLSLTILPGEVRAASRRFGFITYIVDVDFGIDRRASFRCFRSNELLAEIQDVVRTAKARLS